MPERVASFSSHIPLMFLGAFQKGIEGLEVFPQRTLWLKPHPHVGLWVTAS